MIKAPGQDFRGDEYHLINRNCNHFSAILAKTLVGKDIPSWINRLASISGSIPFLEKMLPQEWLTPVALQTSMNHPTSQPSAVKTDRKASIDSAEGATETLGMSRKLNDSRTTVLSGISGDLSSSSSSSSDEGRSSHSTYQRFWKQIRNTVSGDAARP